MAERKRLSQFKKEESLQLNISSKKLSTEKGRKLSPEQQEFLDSRFLIAIRDGKIDEVERLLKLGANIDARTKGTKSVDGWDSWHTGNKSGSDDGWMDGWTALMLAAYKEQKERAELCKLLIENGADVNAKIEIDRGRRGMTALMMAADWCRTPEVCELLLENGADVNAKDDHGRTALMHAKTEFLLSTTRLLELYSVLGRENFKPFRSKFNECIEQ